jgi:hypothetical protein
MSFENAPILCPYFPPLSIDPPKEADTVPLVYTISGPLDHIFGYSDEQLGQEISTLHERSEVYKAEINELNDRERIISMSRSWIRLQCNAKTTGNILSRKWQAIQAIIKDREEAGWYGGLRQQARLDEIAKEKWWKERQDEIQKEKLEERRLRRNENARRRRKGLKTVLQEEREERDRVIREEVIARQERERLIREEEEYDSDSF